MHASTQARVVAADVLGERVELDWVPFFWTETRDRTKPLYTG